MLENKNVLITGSTSGIGFGVAKAFAKNNCNLVINGLGEEAQINRAIQELTELTDGKVVFHGADLTKTDQIKDLMSFAQSELGNVEILVNNAGIQHISSVEDFPEQKWDDIISINLSSVFHTVRHALPTMKSANWGRIINIASVHGQVGSTNKSAYVTAKHGVVGFTKVTALETAEFNITANSICPGWVRTELVEKQINLRADNLGLDTSEAARSLLEEKQPSLQFVTPEQIGDTCVFLCSDATTQMTGTTLTLDGGWTAQ